jgi:predicted nucleic acid-binding protein
VIVVDASVVVELVLGSPAAGQVADTLFLETGRWHAPHLLDAEVAHVLRRYAHLGALSEARGAMALEFLTALPVTRHEAALLLPRVWALRHTATAYDALYVALAELLGATLYTRDRRLARAAERLVAVRVV